MALLNKLLINLIVFLLFLLLLFLFKVKSTIILAVLSLFYVIHIEAPFLVRLCIVAIIFVIIFILALVFVNCFWNDFIVLGVISDRLPSRLHIQAHLSSILQGSRLFLLLKDARFEATPDYLAAFLIEGSLNNLFCWYLYIKGATQIKDLATRYVVSIRFFIYLAFIYYCGFVFAALTLPNFLYRKGEKVIFVYSLFSERCAALWCSLYSDYHLRG